MLQIGVREVVPLVSSSTKESQRSSFATHTGSVGGGWQESGWRSRNMPHFIPVRLPDIEVRTGLGNRFGLGIP